MYDTVVPFHREIPLVGREAELRRAAQALDDLGAGNGGFLEVVGEPGIGKTRLLSAIQAMAQQRGLKVLSGRAAEFEQLIPFQILLDALCPEDFGVRLGELLSPASARALAAAVPGLGPAEPPAFPQSQSQPQPFTGAFGGASADGGSEYDIDRFRLFQALRELLTALADRPLVLVLDDVHWADPGSIDFLAFLSRGPSTAQVLIIVSYRSRQAPAKLRYSLAHSAAGGAARIELPALSRREAAALLGDGPASPRVAELYELSGGNPLYLLELDRSCNGPHVAHGPSRGGGSSHLESLILGEVATLSPEEDEVLCAAAVLGDPFSADMLAALLERPVPGQTEHDINTLVGRDLIRPGEHDPLLVFRHPLVRHAVYHGIRPARRVAIHRSALELLEARGASPVERSRHLEHCAASYQPEQVAVLCQAGAESMSTSPLSAAHWFRVALRLLPGSPRFAAPHFEIAIRLARALVLGGRFAESRDLLHGILSDAPPEVHRSDAVVLCAHAEQRLGRYPEALALLADEIARLGEGGSAERIGLCLEFGLTALQANDYAAAREHISWALEAARDCGDVLAEATALAFSAFGEICDGRTEVARRAADGAKRLVDGLPDGALFGEREALGMLGWAETLLERFADAERHLARSWAIIQRTGHSHGLPHVLLGHALVDLFTGRMEQALRFAQLAEDASVLVGSEHLLGIVLAIKAPIQVWVSPPGESAAALDSARRGAALFTGSAVNSWWHRNALMLRAHAELTNGDAAACVELVARGCGTDLRLLGAPLIPQYAEILAGALIKLGDLEEAERVARLALDAAEGLDLPGQRAHAARLSGLILAIRGRHEEALAAFRDADAGFTQSGKAVEEARTAAYSARSLARLGRPEEAVAALSRSTARAESCGAVWVRDELLRVRGLLDDGPPGPDGAAARREEPVTAHSAASPDLLDALTLREREVAVLVAAGRTNRQIAGRLRLSERTVESHLANVYRKVGVSSRVKLATLVARGREETSTQQE